MSKDGGTGEAAHLHRSLWREECAAVRPKEVGCTCLDLMQVVIARAVHARRFDATPAQEDMVALIMREL